MRVLLIKTSSMGDIIHTLPALTDASIVFPNIEVDWVVEESFAEIPAWHPHVRNVFPISLRRWRKTFLTKKTRLAWQTMASSLQENAYDYVIDAQGLIKSAVLMRYARGLKIGLDWASARESFASLFYQKKVTVNFAQHAITRMRQLFAQACRYSLPDSAINYGLQEVDFTQESVTQPYVVFLHGTTWETKLWPEKYWQKLAKLATSAGFKVKMSGGSTEEIARAERIASVSPDVQVYPRLTITKMAALLKNATAAIAVDTGFGHLAAALDIPTISLYGATNPTLTGALGPTSEHLVSKLPCSPCLKRRCHYRGPSLVQPACYQELTPEKVWERVLRSLR